MEAIRPTDDKIQWNDRPIVWVDATVMERCEDGWVPHLGNGHSKVAIYESAVGTHYKLYAYRSSDKVVTLDSLIPVGMPFKRGNDIFQHWNIGGTRLGLAFNGTADARSFDRGIRVALENLEKAAREQQRSGKYGNGGRDTSGSSSINTSDDGDSPSSAASIVASSAQHHHQQQQRNRSNHHVSAASSSSKKSHRAASLSNNNNPTGATAQQRAMKNSTSSSTASSSCLASPTLKYEHQPHLRNEEEEEVAVEGATTKRRHSSVPGRACRVGGMSRHSPPAPDLLPCPPLSASHITEHVTTTPPTSTSRKDDVRSQNAGACALITTSVTMTNEKSSTSHHHHHARHHQHHGSGGGGRRQHRSSSNGGGGGGNGGGGSGRIRMSKPPTLSKLDQKRDMQPTKYNSYVQINDPTNSINQPASGQQQQRGSSGAVVAHPLGASSTRGAHTISPLPPVTAGGYPTAGTDYRFYMGGSKSVDPANDPMLMPFKPVSGRGVGSKGSSKRDLGERLRCRHCQSYYNQDRNLPGSCRDAPPDQWQRCFRYASCMICANAMLYHGCRDEEGNYPRASCSCTDRRDHNGYSLPRRWLTIFLLSLMVPCLCLYPLLAACHKCGVACKCCGGRHEPPVHSSSANDDKRLR